MIPHPAHFSRIFFLSVHAKRNHMYAHSNPIENQIQTILLLLYKILTHLDMQSFIGRLLMGLSMYAYVQGSIHVQLATQVHSSHCVCLLDVTVCGKNNNLQLHRKIGKYSDYSLYTKLSYNLCFACSELLTLKSLPALFSMFFNLESQVVQIEGTQLLSQFNQRLLKRELFHEIEK